MEIHIIKDKSNPLLKRREISICVKNKSTVTRIELKNKLAALLNSKPELIIVERLDSLYGKQEMVSMISVYETEERLNQIAHQHLIARDAPKVVEGAEAAPAPAAPAEAPPSAPEVK